MQTDFSGSSHDDQVAGSDLVAHLVEPDLVVQTDPAARQRHAKPLLHVVRPMFFVRLAARVDGLLDRAAHLIGYPCLEDTVCLRAHFSGRYA